MGYLMLPRWLRHQTKKRFKTRRRLIIILVFLIVVPATCLFATKLMPKTWYPYSTYVGYPLTIYDHPYNIKINNSFDSCSTKNAVIVIHSKVTNFLKRKTIRRTWANRALMSRFGFKVVFFLGMPFADDIQTLVDEEVSEFGDVVQGSFYDSCLNMTHKAVLVLRWITEVCKNPSVVVKVNDDVFINVFRLYHSFLSTVKSETLKAWCEVKPPFTQKIRRTKGEKYRVADHEFKGYSRYPVPYCRGYFVIITPDSVRAIYKAAKRTPFFWIDDIHVYGTLANKTGTQLVQIKHYLEAEKELQALSCFESKDELCPLLAVLIGSSETMESLWNKAIDQSNLYHRRLQT